jgi:PAS domain S-box-containing protein
MEDEQPGADARLRTERKRMEEALRASEERFRALVQLSFDVYWETDEQHRFTRQEFSQRLADAPARGSEIGKARWEVPYLEPDEEAWRQHRAVLDAHLPFRDFELARPTPDGGKRYVSVSGMPMFDEAGRFLGYRGVGRHITELKRAEQEHRAHVWFLESMDRINRAMQVASDLEKTMSEVLEALLDIFVCDRAWLVYPCDPQAASWRVVMERTRPEYPGAFTLQSDIPTDADAAAGFAAARAASGAVLEVPAPLAERFSVRSRMAMAMYPQGDSPYLFGIHQCSHPRAWTADERRLFEEVGHRLTDTLSSLIAVRRLRESERRLEEAQRVAHLGYWDRDFVANRVVLAEESWRIFGVEPHERPADLAEWNRRWRAFILPEDRPRVLAAVQAALAGGPRYDVEFRILRKNGEVRVIHSQGDVLRDASGRALRMFGTQQDITALRQAEQELRARQDMLDLAQKAARAVAFDWYIGAREHENRWSPELEAMYGLEPGTFDRTYLGWKKLVHPDDWPSVRLAIERANQSGDIDAEYRVVHKDGAVRWLHAKGRMFFDAEGRPERMVGFMIDVTDRRQAEEELRAADAALRRTQAYLAEAQRLSHSGSWAYDATGAPLYWSEEMFRIYGIDPQHGAPARAQRDARIHPQDLEVVRQARRKLLQEKAAVEFEHRIVLPDGRVRHAYVWGHPVLGPDGEVRETIGTTVDITERKLADEALRASEARFRTFVDHAIDAFFLHDEQLKLVDVNRQACQSLGYTREELIGMHPREFDAGLEEAAIARLAELARAGEKLTFETRHRRKAGTVFPVEIRTGTFRQGEKLFYLSLARDISERKLVEETLRGKEDALQAARAELARVSRVTTLGELTAAIAHEVNQPLGAMVANAAACTRWLAADPPETARARRALESIAADGRRASEIIGRIRALVKRQAPRKDLVDVNLKIAQVIELAADEIRRNGVVLRTELTKELPRVEGDRVQLQQVLLNLILNAIDAMNAVRDRPRELTVASRREGAQEVLVEVRDTGPGLEPEHAERLFEPFFTTKAEGLGIGLSISRSIVEAHGGRLWVDANQPHGAMFRFSLPAGEAAR